MNSVNIVGRIATDIYHYDGEDEKPSNALFTVAVNYAEDKADFIRVTAFGSQADNNKKHLAKGRMVAIEAEIKTSRKERDGESEFFQDIVQRRIRYLDKPQDSK